MQIKSQGNTAMSKTSEELNALKKEIEAVNEKLQEHTPEELEQVCGGAGSLYTVISQLSLPAKN